jgi:L-lactate dehydrogenase complex protein LldG
MSKPTNAREDVLAGVRRALAGAPKGQVGVPRGYRATRAAGGPLHTTADLFAERVADYRAVVVRCAPEEVEDRIAEALGHRTRVVVPDALPWHVEGAVRDDGLSALDLDALDAVVTAATVGIATTGTIVLSHGPGEGRRALTLVPDVHVCVVRADQVVADVPDAVAVLDPTRPTTWISGPSATSDIELDRVEGVHGPRNLHVIVAG